MRIAHKLAAGLLALSASTSTHAANIQNLAAGPAICPLFEVGASQDSIWVSELITEPLALDFEAGGDVALAGCADVPGTGYVVESPDLTLTLRGMESVGLDLYVMGECDTVLLVNAADGSWYYSDDFEGGEDPLITLDQGSSGQYDVWIGTYGTDTCAATLFVEAYDPLLVS